MACGVGKQIQAHHVNYRHPITDCTIDDLMPLCRPCHELAHQTKVAAECAALLDNDARRLHVILAIQSARRLKPAQPRPAKASAKPTRRPNGLLASEHHAQSRKKRQQRQVDNARIGLRYAIAPNSSADIYQKQMAELRAKRQAEDREKVNSTLKNLYVRIFTPKESQRERRIAALNRNGLNVKSAAYY